MRSDWDRRIAHDYRFWMSDGYASDEAMWEAGARDFSIITRDIESSAQKSILEIGCGVGRLLRSALAHFGEVTGLDVSQVAIEKASELLGEDPKLRLIAGDGDTLTGVETESIDVVFSFAALTSMPVAVIAKYLREAHRVLKPGGVFRLQIYLGEEQSVSWDDTLHLRCFQQSNFEKALQAAGFEKEWIEELELPFQVSFPEAGIVAHVASFRKRASVAEAPERLAELLLPGGEGDETKSVSGVEVEYWMALNYAKELAERGDIRHAKETLEYALSHSNSVTIDVRDLLERILKLIEEKETEQQGRVEAAPIEGDYGRNIALLKERFPAAAERMEKLRSLGGSSVEARETEQGVSLFVDGQSLDHPTKPVAAAEGWAKREATRPEFKTAKQIVVYGSGAGYHLEALFPYIDEKELHLVEASEQVFLAALQNRDLSAVLSKLETLTVGENLETLPVVGRETELLVRTQSQVLSSDHCGKVRAKFYGVRGLDLLTPSITVLGPIQGGTLPILNYTASGLASLHQRIRTVDMSAFKDGFGSLDGLYQDEMRLNLMRGKYTEMLSELVLEMANEKPMDILICMAQAPISGKTLTELRKRGVITVLWFVEDYLRFPVWKYMAQFYDFVFTIQRGECLNAIKAAGAGEVHYLPTACDPIVHAPAELTEKEKQRWGSPISFVGAGYHNRQQLFASLSNMPFKIWGTEWPEGRPFDRLVQEGGRRLKPEEYVKIFSATDVNINLHSSTERDGVDPFGDFLNPRTFELASTGAFQLVDHREYLAEVLEPGKEVVVFHNREDLIEKIQYYLERPEEREAIAQAGRERVHREHTYAHRLRDMLSIIYSSKFEVLKRRKDSSPWSRMLHRAKPHAELHQRCEAAFHRGEEPNLDGLVSDIVNGQGKLSETEQKLLFLFHIRKQMIRMRHEERGGK